MSGTVSMRMFVFVEHDLQLPAERCGDAAKSVEARNMIAALQPFQALLGQWRWTTNKKFEGFSKSGEDLEWIWDFQRDPTQPSLTAKCPNHPYFQQIWLTWVPEAEKFELTAKPLQGAERPLCLLPDGHRLQRTPQPSKLLRGSA